MICSLLSNSSQAEMDLSEQMYICNWRASCIIIARSENHRKCCRYGSGYQSSDRDFLENIRYSLTPVLETPNLVSCVLTYMSIFLQIFCYTITKYIVTIVATTIISLVEKWKPLIERKYGLDQNTIP